MTKALLSMSHLARFSSFRVSLSVMAECAPLSGLSSRVPMSSSRMSDNFGGLNIGASGISSMSPKEVFIPHMYSLLRVWGSLKLRALYTFQVTLKPADVVHPAAALHPVDMGHQVDRGHRVIAAHAVVRMHSQETP